MKLTKEDYIKILNYYKINHNNKSYSTIKRKAENILADKLCRCIKRVKIPSDIDESRAIGICKSSVLNKKNISAGRFSCKKRARFLKNSKTKYTLKKIKYN